MTSRCSALFGVLAGLAPLTPARAGGAEVESIVPGEVTPLPGKGALPRREDMLNLAVGGSVLAGDGAAAGEAVAALRLAEALGVGGGLRVGGAGPAAFLRLDALGLAINHWAFLAYADYVLADGWAFGGAMIVPVRRDSYLRLSINSDGDQTLFGVGLEHDVW